MIDLSDLKPIADVTIRLTPLYFDLLFSANCADKFIDKIKDDLQSADIDVYTGIQKNQLTVFPRNYCITQLAERIATSLEGNGLIVRRLIPEPGKQDRSPRKEIQSFILA